MDGFSAILGLQRISLGVSMGAYNDGRACLNLDSMNREAHWMNFVLLSVHILTGIVGSFSIWTYIVDTTD